jgi:hypothetical protein
MNVLLDCTVDCAHELGADRVWPAIRARKGVGDATIDEGAMDVHFTWAHCNCADSSMPGGKFNNNSELRVHTGPTCIIGIQQRWC